MTTPLGDENMTRRTCTYETWTAIDAANETWAVTQCGDPTDGADRCERHTPKDAA